MDKLFSKLSHYYRSIKITLRIASMVAAATPGKADDVIIALVLQALECIKDEVAQDEKKVDE